ncbi:response regulator [candidate division KSB1 bacterium]|nr:response regulator [candidate division KSB1 bacterium]
MKNKKVLVVEDELIISMEIQDRLQDLGFMVVGAVPSSEKAIASYIEKSPDLIFMDIQLQDDIDGIETASHIRRFSDVPIIFLTAYSNKESRKRAGEIPFSFYMNKPFSEYEIHNIITNVFTN